MLAALSNGIPNKRDLSHTGITCTHLMRDPYVGVYRVDSEAE